MAFCDQACSEAIIKMTDFSDWQVGKRALDAGGGDGRMSQQLFSRLHHTVDLFDICPAAIAETKFVSQKEGFIEQSSMQEFAFRHRYHAVYMVWVSGYLGDAELVAFLRRAKAHLSSSGRQTRGSKRSSFIYVLDNIRPESLALYTVKGQRVRS